MQVVILLAGQGTRMGSLTQDNHKSLLRINDTETFLSYILHQIEEYPVSRVVLVTGYKSELIEQEARKHQVDIEIVYNERYKDDTNIYSLKLAMERVLLDKPVIIIEGDVYMDDLALKQVFDAGLKGWTTWFTRGRFNSSQYGGILKVQEGSKNIVDIQIVRKYSDVFKRYYKLLGVMIVGIGEMRIFRELLEKYALKSINQYYLMPWIENLNILPCRMVDLAEFYVESVNSADEYHSFVKKLDERQSIGAVELVNIKQLLPIEGYVKSHFDALFDVISNSQYWIKPIIVERTNYLVLDGHHRFEIAKKMKLKMIPAIFVSYQDVDVWSLRKDEFVSKNTVIQRALQGDVYPPKTVKHRFRFRVSSCLFDMDKLR